LAGGGLPCILVVPFCSLLLGVFRLMGFRFCGLALAVPVYLGVSYAFINKVFLLIKNKSSENVKICEITTELDKFFERDKEV